MHRWWHLVCAPLRLDDTGIGPLLHLPVDQCTTSNKAMPSTSQQKNTYKRSTLDFCVLAMYVYIYIYVHIYIPGTHLSFVFIPKEGLFQSKQGSFGLQVNIYVCSYILRCIYSRHMIFLTQSLSLLHQTK